MIICALLNTENFVEAGTNVVDIVVVGVVIVVVALWMASNRRPNRSVGEKSVAGFVCMYVRVVSFINAMLSDAGGGGKK